MKIIKAKFFLGLLVSLICLSDLTAEEIVSTLVSGNVMVDVGDRNNAGYFLSPNLLGGLKLGAVDYNYQIGKYEVTVGDWYCFLTAVASHCDQNLLVDAHHLWSSEMESWITCAESFDGSHIYEIVRGKEKLPITHVSLLSAMRYCNWIERGAPVAEIGGDIDAITEHGSYNFSEDGGVIENEGSHIYIPTEDEWVKAGYYAGGGRNVGYWEYPTKSNLVPTFNSDSVYRIYGQQLANYNGKWSAWDWTTWSYHSERLAPLTLTDVDFFNNSHSYYGCRDMGGNVNEWTTTLNVSGKYIVRGGSYQSCSEDLMIVPIEINSYSSETESSLIGFRIVARNLDHDDIFSNQLHDSKISVAVDHSAQTEQTERERWELIWDLLAMVLLPLGIVLIATNPAPGSKILGIFFLIFLLGCDIYDTMRLLGLDCLRLITK